MYNTTPVITCYFSCFKRNTISLKPHTHIVCSPNPTHDMLEWSCNTTWVWKFYSNECLHLLRLLLFWQTEFSAGIVIVKKTPIYTHNRAQEHFLRTKKKILRVGSIYYGMAACFHAIFTQSKEKYFPNLICILSVFCFRQRPNSQQTLTLVCMCGRANESVCRYTYYQEKVLNL